MRAGHRALEPVVVRADRNPAECAQATAHSSPLLSTRTGTPPSARAAMGNAAHSTTPPPRPHPLHPRPGNAGLFLHVRERRYYGSAPFDPYLRRKLHA